MKNLSNFDNFILESNSLLVLSKEDKDTLLKLDEKYHQLIENFRTKFVAVTVDNLREEFDKFMWSHNCGVKYYPKLRIANSDVDEQMINDMSSLITEFKNLNVYVSKFYIEKLTSMINSLEKRKKIDDNTYVPGSNPILKSLYKEALQCIKENPYVKPDFKHDRTITPKEAKKRIEDAIKELGYDFSVRINSGMMPRMNVSMGYVNINSKAKFSEEDIEGLIAHEIKGHVGRRFYGKQTGLWLFAYGLQDSSTYDEGLAVWNSLNITEKQKPNVLFNIALKVCISYLMYEMDFIELFDWVKKHAKNMTDLTAFKCVTRPKRGVKDCEIRSGEPMTTYFRGYKMVCDMDDKLRDDILHYNVGPTQVYELDLIKEFLKVNKFTPLK